jgi:glycerol uptake facilitator-like aquaporin
MMLGALLLGSILTIASRYGVLADKARAWAPAIAAWYLPSGAS